MKLSVIVPWFDSGDPFRRRSMHWLMRRYRALLPEVEFTWGAADTSVEFNRSATRNFLVENSSGDVLFITDADTIFHVDQVRAAYKLIEEGVPWVIPYALGKYYNLTQETTARILANDPYLVVPEPLTWIHKLDSWAGLLMVTRSAFNQVGGYDPRFRGWGYEDNAFRAALDIHVGPHQRTEHYALHLWHPTTEAENFGQPYIGANRDLCRQYEAGYLRV